MASIRNMVVLASVLKNLVNMNEDNLGYSSRSYTAYDVVNLFNAIGRIPEDKIIIPEGVDSGIIELFQQFNGLYTATLPYTKNGETYIPEYKNDLIELLKEICNSLKVECPWTDEELQSELQTLRARAKKEAVKAKIRSNEFNQKKQEVENFLATNPSVAAMNAARRRIDQSNDFRNDILHPKKK